MKKPYETSNMALKQQSNYHLKQNSYDTLMQDEILDLPFKAQHQTGLLKEYRDLDNQNDSHGEATYPS